jgi:Gpi18-like mannosyltransferase
MSAAPSHKFTVTCALLIVIGFVARVALAWYSIGTNDAGAWERFARGVDARGLRDAYARFPSLNHPPLPVLWAGSALGLARGTGAPFAFVFKLPAVLADAASCAILASVVAARRGRRAGWAAAVAMALSPAAILVGAYHCNTDNVYAMLCLLACALLDRGRSFGAGTALAAAVNVKLIPVLLIPPLLAICRTRRDAQRFLAGCALGAIPLLIAWIDIGPAFAQHVLAYSPRTNRWGIAFVLYELYLNEPTRRVALDLMRFYFEAGRWFILAAVAMLSFFAWRRRTWDAYELGALTLSIFLLLTPGFGLQYVVVLVPLLLAVNVTAGTIYGLISGAFLAAAYASVWTGTVPLYSFFDGPIARSAAVLGAAAWLMLAWYTVRALAGFSASVSYTPPRDEC